MIGIQSHSTRRVPVHQPGHSPSAGHWLAKLPPRIQSPMFTRAYHNDRSIPLTASIPTHVFEIGSVPRLLSPGFSLNKSTFGSFVITCITSCDIRRLEVDDIVVAVDGRVLSPEDTLDDVVRFLEEPIGTSAQLMLMKNSGGTGGVVRKSAHFLRSMSFQRHENCDFRIHDGTFVSEHSDTNLKHDFSNSAHFYDADEEIEECHSEYSDENSSAANQSSSSSSHREHSFPGAGVGLAFCLYKKSNEFYYFVDHILQSSPADRCGRIDGEFFHAG